MKIRSATSDFITKSGVVLRILSQKPFKKNDVSLAIILFISASDRNKSGGIIYE